jgi:hypothetical protein
VALYYQEERHNFVVLVDARHHNFAATVDVHPLVVLIPYHPHVVVPVPGGHHVVVVVAAAAAAVAAEAAGLLPSYWVALCHRGGHRNSAAVVQEGGHHHNFVAMVDLVDIHYQVFGPSFAVAVGHQVVVARNLLAALVVHHTHLLVVRNFQVA